MKFRVYQHGELEKKFSLQGTCLFGLDRIPLRDAKSISFKNGVIECKTRNVASTGIVLLWPVEGFGRILLQTTRLPVRDRPYILNVELARGQLMEITLKREDWSVFEQTKAMTKLLRDAQDLFIQALQNISDAPKASVFAGRIT